MPKSDVLAKVLENKSVSSDGLVKKMTLLAPQIAAAKPGQFVNIKVSENSHPLLRRPFSIAEAKADEGTIAIIYRVVGKGTAIMAKARQYDYFRCMGPLGEGFRVQGKKPLLVGGGMGLAPLLFLAGQLEAPAVLMGGRNARELFWMNLFADAAGIVHPATDDGSLGFKGFATKFLSELLVWEQFDIIYACGPRPMLKETAEIAKRNGLSCQVSLEEHMACGVGACLSCTCADISGKRRKICTDGPVFDALEVAW